MCKVKVRGISLEQIRQLVEMTRFFYGEEDDTHVFQDPDIPSNIVISSGKGDNYNTVGWHQVCFDLILPKIVEVEEERLSTGLVGKTEIIYSFVDDTIIRHNYHPVDMLYSPFLAIKSEKEDE